MRAILTFHDVSERRHVLSYPVDAFIRLVGSLMEQGVRICTLDELLVTRSPQAVTLTFDDGMESVYDNVLPVLRDMGVPAHVYVVTARVGTANHWDVVRRARDRFRLMDWDQLGACQEAGLCIGNHTASHSDLARLDRHALAQECEGADAELVARLGCRAVHFAYPYGRYTVSVQEYVAARYQTAVTTELRYLSVADDHWKLPRLDSYYLRQPMLFERIASPLCHAYIASRDVLRRFKQALPG